MKLLNCLKCDDIVALTDEYRQCWCGKSSGMYVTDLLVEYRGPSRILGITNSAYVDSRRTKTKLINGLSMPTWSWFVIVEGEHIKHCKDKTDREKAKIQAWVRRRFG